MSGYEEVPGRVAALHGQPRTTTDAFVEPKV